MRASVVPIVVVALCAACSAPMARMAPDELGLDPVAELASAVAALGAGVDAEEAKRVAYAAWTGAAALAREYRLVRPPLWHNALVNSGLRERGLCCHFAADMLVRLRSLELETLELHWVVARHGSQLREHSGVLLQPRGVRFERGLVLDAWRGSGRLAWVRADDDGYPWRIHPLDGRWSELHCN
jgi:hypothetical protein